MILSLSLLLICNEVCKTLHTLYFFNYIKQYDSCKKYELCERWKVNIFILYFRFAIVIDRAYSADMIRVCNLCKAPWLREEPFVLWVETIVRHLVAGQAINRVSLRPRVATCNRSSICICIYTRLQLHTYVYNRDSLLFTQCSSAMQWKGLLN